MAPRTSASVLRKESEERSHRVSSVSIRVIVGAVRLLADAASAASIYLKVLRMILLLLPPVREAASVLMGASVSISLDEVLGLPLFALLLLVLEAVRLPSEVLPIVGIDAHISRVRGVAIWTPDSLKMEHVEIGAVDSLVRGLTILCGMELMYKIYCDLVLRVSESTHISIVTRLYTRWVALAEFHLILFWVIKLLYPIVCLRATVPQRALVIMLLRDDVGAYL